MTGHRALLVDSHCHLDFPDFGDELDDVVDRAGAAGIGHMVTISTHLSRFERVLGVAERFNNIFCTVGIHPHQAASEPETDAETLVAMAKHPKVVGIGETGLDFYYERSPRDVQERQFRAHIDAARESGLPLIVHTRDADDDTIRVMRESHDQDGPFPGLIHCFSAGQEVADAALDMGLYISISGIVTFKNAEALRETVKQVALDRLLVETDSPFLAPIPNRGKRNEPAFTAHTAAKVAEIRDMAFDDLARATTDNFFSLFTKARDFVGSQGAQA
ncbi:MAG: TatD family hydrolase [Rhodospirillaceae bacterium]